MAHEQETRAARIAVDKHRRDQDRADDSLIDRNAQVRALITAYLKAGQDPPPWAEIGEEIGMGASSVRALGSSLVEAHRRKHRR